MYRGRPPTDVAPGAVSGPFAAVASAAVAVAPIAHAAAESRLDLTNPLIWTFLAISVAGAIVTFAFLVYAMWRFRDPAVKRRRYG
jgi:heme/copper-type cytochrome/quinol oxidase subunit 2